MEPLASYSPHYAVIRDGGVEQATPQSQPQLQSQPGTTLPQPLPPTDPTNSQSPPTPDDMAPPPSYIAYRPSFEPFTTDRACCGNGAELMGRVHVPRSRVVAPHVCHSLVNAHAQRGRAVSG